MKYIRNITAEYLVDILYLPNGMVVGINDECIVLYQNIDHFYGEGEGKPLGSIEIPELTRAYKVQYLKQKQMEWYKQASNEEKLEDFESIVQNGFKPYEQRTDEQIDTEYYIQTA